MASKRRWVLALGVVLFVGGWGGVHYTDARQDALSGRARTKAWNGNGDVIAARYMYLGGIAAMAVGAICVVLAKN
ncbi:MAG: hypothetical protein ACYS0D_11080 [Planctomycetota bacterium]